MSTSTALEARYVAQEGVVHMTGVHALARLPLDVRRADVAEGRRTAVFISGYEGSPLGGYDLELLRHSDLLVEHDVVFRPGLNEELAATAVQGSQLSGAMEGARFEGVTGIWYGKSPGLDRASDAIRHANLGGADARGGAVALVGDDPTAKSSTVPGTSELLLADLGIPTLYPADPQEVLDLGLHAVWMSRVTGLWSALKVVTNVADGSGTVDVAPGRLAPKIPDRTFNGSEFTHEVSAKFAGAPRLALEQTRNGQRLQLARRYARANGLNRVSGAGSGARIGIVAAGKTYMDLLHALRLLGIADDLEEHGVRLLKFGMIHPLDPETVLDFADGLDEIVVVEEKRAFLETAIKDILFDRATSIRVHGKRDDDGSELFATQGELGPDSIATGLARRLVHHGDFPTVRALEAKSPRRSRTMLPLAVRTPYFCSGCPHNSSTRVPEGSLVGGGIGCHGLAMFMAPAITGDVGGLTQMGGEGTQWIGMSPFLERDHLFQNLGDGTFHHSGSLAIRAAVAAGVNITYKLLYNSAVAMTGGQQAIGQMSVPDVSRAMIAEGVKRVVITTDDLKAYRRARLPRGVKVYGREHLLKVQEELAKVDGVTLLIHDQECATELRRKRKRGLAVDPVDRVMINERVCEGCGDCGMKSNCLSVQPIDTEFGRKTRIDQSSCNKDYSCLEGDCPSFLSVVPAKKPVRKSSSGRARPASLAVDEIVEPVAPALDDGDQHTTRMLGIGGSGVVTLSQILSVAATHAGLHVASLDQTGLAQKGGAVVSDVKISRSPLGIANKAVLGEADLYLGADLLVAADPNHLAVADPARTNAVVSTAIVPTGHMVSDVNLAFPPVEQLVATVQSSTRPAGDFIDARAVSVALFGVDQFANMLLVGIGYQRGSLPIPAASIEEAIGVNGVKVDQNRQAFRRGRQFVTDPVGLHAAVERMRPTRPAAKRSDEVQRLLDVVESAEVPALRNVLEVRVPDLVDYQNVAYAQRFVDEVEALRLREVEINPSLEVTAAFARNLYKLMAYKDEYEVARLSLDPQIKADVESQFGPGARLSYRLHPPVLRALGMKNKLSLGPWFRPVFKVLRAARRLRGTPLDLFGYATVRRVERALVQEYIDALHIGLNYLKHADQAGVKALADLPDMVRGYETIKLANVGRYRAAVASQLDALREKTVAA